MRSKIGYNIPINTIASSSQPYPCRHNIDLPPGPHTRLLHTYVVTGNGTNGCRWGPPWITTPSIAGLGGTRSPKHSTSVASGVDAPAGRRRLAVVDRTPRASVYGMMAARESRDMHTPVLEDWIGVGLKRKARKNRGRLQELRKAEPLNSTPYQCVAAEVSDVNHP